MSNIDAETSTGLPGLDRVLKGILPGDNIVWQVNSVDDYLPFVNPFVEYAQKESKALVYFRFAKHRALVKEDSPAEVHHVSPEAGFESFLLEIHKVIEKTGYGAFYVFDCLSDLIVDWYSDRMLGNFFMLTCPYLYDLRTIAYFGLLRGHHSFHAVKPIMDTTQLFLNVYRHKGELYVHPLKIQQRYSPTIHMLHVKKGDDFYPVTRSVTNSEILTSDPWTKLESSSQLLGPWTSAFQHAEEVAGGIESGTYSAEQGGKVFERLLRMAVTRSERLLKLAKKYLTLSDVLEIRKRMIGTGLIGGKAVGFLLARNILKRTDERWAELLEVHDSFFVGSDVFYTFLVENGCWWVRQKQKNPDTFLDDAEEARKRMLVGTFPDYIAKQFEDLLDYFGQSPFIVRSSSLQEDSFGNSFSGKYESVFCPNQGPRKKRLDDFVSAIRTIYASTMSEDALSYRAQREILELDEQMALLVQRVSGDRYGHFFYPQVAGVGLSFNPYVWSEYIDPDSGVLRIVFGLGTRAVDRVDDDYTRIVALNDPKRRPEANFSEVKQHAQRRVDVLDLEGNRLVSEDFIDVERQSPNLPVQIFSSPDQELRQNAAIERKGASPPILTFNRLLLKTPFVDDMREMLKTLKTAYDHPVDVEFTTNFFDEDTYRINLLQCRPLEVKEGGPITDPPEEIARDDLILEARGAVIGYSRLGEIDRFIYILPEAYSRLPIRDRYSLSQLIGRLTRDSRDNGYENVMLIGPGRWGTTTPSLGVPVSFSQVSGASVLCEIVAMRDDIVPDVSLGTHFFNDLVEADILYLALFPSEKSGFLNKAFFEQSPNKLAEIVPSDAGWSDAVRVIDTRDFLEDTTVKLNANTFKQRVVCYLER